MTEIQHQTGLQSPSVAHSRDDPETTSTAMVIAGMHRSGTSLMANYFAHCGVNVGENLLAPAFDNPVGYYEDMDFVSLHEAILEDNRQSWHSPSDTSQLKVSADHAKKVARIAAQRANLPLWGWKDPRTVLLLDFWAAQLPHAVFVFVYRDPAKVVRSLLSRRDVAMYWHALLIPAFPRHFKAARLWTQYNSRILRFMDAHPNRCILFELEEIIEADADIAGIVRDRFQLDALSSAPIGQVLDRKILSSKCRSLDRLVCKVDRRCRDTYNGLRERRHVVGGPMAAQTT